MSHLYKCKSSSYSLIRNGKIGINLALGKSSFWGKKRNDMNGQKFNKESRKITIKPSREEKVSKTRSDKALNLC